MDVGGAGIKKAKNHSCCAALCIYWLQSLMLMFIDWWHILSVIFVLFSNLLRNERAFGYVQNV